MKRSSTNHRHSEAELPPLQSHKIRLARIAKTRIHPCTKSNEKACIKSHKHLRGCPGAAGGSGNRAGAHRFQSGGDGDGTAQQQQSQPAEHPVRTEYSRRIRKAFLPQQSWTLLSADDSQIEMRILTHLSGEDLLQLAYRPGNDLHALTARLLLKVHDELVLEVDPAALDSLQELVISTMENAIQPTVPLVVETGSGANWMDTKSKTFPSSLSRDPPSGISKCIQRRQTATKLNA